MSDGESEAEAVAHARDAFSVWMSARADMGKPIPSPTCHGEAAEPVRMMQRLPRSLHARLVARAKGEGTSLNTLVTMLLAEDRQNRTAGLNPLVRMAYPTIFFTDIRHAYEREIVDGLAAVADRDGWQ